MFKRKFTDVEVQYFTKGSRTYPSYRHAWQLIFFLVFSTALESISHTDSMFTF